MEEKILDKLYITEIINDLHRNGFISGGKAQVMLHDWSRQLREAVRPAFPASKLRAVHAQEAGKENW